MLTRGKGLFNWVFGMSPWKPEWQEELTRVLQTAQTGLSVNMVVVIARESDIYAELLFILSFIGVSLGTLVAHFMRGYWGFADDLVMVPLLGFAAGATLYTFRRFFIHRWAPKAIRDRVSQKAKSQFYDHLQHLKTRLTLVYFSELEREALFFSSPDITPEMPSPAIQTALSNLVINYSQNDPLATLRPCLNQIGDALRTQLQPSANSPSLLQRVSQPVFIKASDRQAKEPRVPILKGSKDIN